MSQVVTQSRSESLRKMLLGLIPGMFIDAALPYIIYILLQPHTTELNALIASSIPPLISNIVSLARSRKLDVVGMIVFLGIAVSIIAIFLGGDPRILLIRESLVTVMLGVLCLVSLLFPKPFMYYLSQHFAQGISFADYWQYAGFRRYMYVITIAWGVFFVGEFVLKVILVFSLPIAMVIGLTPIIFYGLLVFMIVGTMIYSRKMQRNRPAATPLVEPVSSEGAAS